MNLSRLFAASLLGLATFAALTPSVSATTAMYPMVVPAYRNPNQYGSAEWVNRNGAVTLQLNNAYNGSNDYVVGWEVYYAKPGTSMSKPSSGTTGPAGTYTFSISGLPATGAVVCCSLDAVNNLTCAKATIVNGQATVVAPPAYDLGSNIVAVQFYVDLTPYKKPVSVNPTIYISNFKLNGASLVLDTVNTDCQPNYSSALGFCDSGNGLPEKPNVGYFVPRDHQ